MDDIRHNQIQDKTEALCILVDKTTLTYNSGARPLTKHKEQKLYFGNSLEKAST